MNALRPVTAAYIAFLLGLAFLFTAVAARRGPGVDPADILVAAVATASMAVAWLFPVQFATNTQYYVDTAVMIVVTVPKGIKAYLLLAGPGFGRGEKVRIEKSNELKAGKRRVDVQVDVFIPANDDLEVGVEFAPRLLGILGPDIAEGRTSSWVKLKTKL